MLGTISSYIISGLKKWFGPFTKAELFRYVFLGGIFVGVGPIGTNSRCQSPQRPGRRTEQQRSHRAGG